MVSCEKALKEERNLVLEAGDQAVAGGSMRRKKFPMNSLLRKVLLYMALHGSTNQETLFSRTPY